jgi:hypothetical protein
MSLPKGQRLYLDLGQVGVIARIKLNGKDLGIAWTTPYRLNITNAVRQGPNTLEVDVVNLWTNRLIGDQLLPEDKRYTHATWNPYTPANWTAWTKNAKPQPSGLLGPVCCKSPININFLTNTTSFWTVDPKLKVLGLSMRSILLSCLI